jgi:hypothetical protein
LARWQPGGAIDAVRRFEVGVGLGGLSKQARPQSWEEVVYLGNRKKLSIEPIKAVQYIKSLIFIN